MDHDDAMVGRILTRRETLRLSARAGLALGLAGLASRAWAADGGPTTRPKLPLIVSPALTEGPFFVDEKLNRSDITSDTTRASVIHGLPLQLAITVYEVAGDSYKPLKGAQVDVWHTDAIGVYSDENNPMNHEDTSGQKWLRGYQITDEQGLAQFKTIFPGWYGGRAPHIHFKVRKTTPAGSEPRSTAEFTSQFFFHEEDATRIYAAAPYTSRAKGRFTKNTEDGIYRERQSDGSTAGSLLTLDIGPGPASGVSALFPLILNNDSYRSGRGGRGRGPGPGGPGGPPGGPGRGRPPGPPPDGFDGPPPPP